MCQNKDKKAKTKRALLRLGHSRWRRLRTFASLGAGLDTLGDPFLRDAIIRKHNNNRSN